MKITIQIILFFTLLAVQGCSKKTATTPALNYGNATIEIVYKVDALPLAFDTLLYTNESGNAYSVERLQYYLSGFRFYRQGSLAYTADTAIYLDARRDSVSSFSLSFINGIPPGQYDSLVFTVGLEPALNITNGLPQTLDNIGMGWPDAMGGGYHFLKLEGHWNNGGTLSGYAMHLGQNGYVCYAGAHCSFTVPVTGNTGIKLEMNINEWFRSPWPYSFSTDGVYSMGDTALMRKLALNGADAFSQ